MKKYRNFKSKGWAFFSIILSMVISLIAAAFFSAFVATITGTTFTSVQFFAVAIMVFFARTTASGPRGALYANFTFGMTSFGTLGDSENPGGLRGYILHCPTCDITAHPALASLSGSSTDSDAVTLTGSYTMVSAKVFKTVYGLDHKFKFSSKKIAERGGAGFEHTLECEFTGDHDALMGFMRRYASVPGVFVCVTPEGTQYVLGTDAYPAWVETAEYTTGAGMKELRNSKVSIKCYSLAPVQKYDGTVPIS